MNTHKWFSILFVLILCLTGCSHPSSLVAAPTTVEAPIVTGSTSTTSPTQPVPTPQHTPSFTATPTIQAAEMVETGLITSCLSIETVTQQQLNLPGVIIFSSVSLDAQTFLMDLSTGVLTEIQPQQERWLQYSMSPDNKYLAFYAIDKENHLDDKISIIDAQGKEVISIPWNESEWYEFGGWINNQTLGIVMKSTDVNVMNGFAPAPLLTLNPYTGETNRIEPAFPNIVLPNQFPFPQWSGGLHGVSYDPTLTYAIYPIYADSSKEMYTYALLNIKTNEIVTTLNDIFLTYSLYDVYHQPIWSADGKFFSLLSTYLAVDESQDPFVYFEAYRVFASGAYERLTYTNPIFVPEDPNMRLSPDGNLLSVFLDRYGIRETWTRVAVVDVKSQTVTNYCLPITHYLQTPMPVVWSPDSTKLLVVDNDEEGHSKVILIDVVMNSATIIAEDLIPIGWMVAP